MIDFEPEYKQKTMCLSKFLIKIDNNFLLLYTKNRCSQDSFMIEPICYCHNEGKEANEKEDSKREHNIHIF